MSKIDDKYIDALKDFTEALDEIVKTLKEQQKTGKADVVNEMLKNVPDQLKVVVEDLKKVTVEGFKSIKSDNEKIIKEIQSIKQQKESGMFDKIEDPKNKNKIVDGIKVVVLIAAGVLALGLAFKIIGKVDFLSVIALSTAMLLMAKSYAEISKVEGLTYRKVFMTALILPIMALGLLGAGWILKGFPTFGVMQGISLILVGGALGIATYLILKSLQKINTKSLIFIPLIPIMLPLIALGLVKASKILQGIVPLSIMQVFSIALVGIAIGIATFAIGLALKGMKNITWKEMLALPLMIPLIAGGIVMASIIFQGFVPLKDGWKLLKDCFFMGISILMFVPAIYILGKIGFTQIVKGSIGILAVAGLIYLTAWIFSDLPPDMKYPPLMWSVWTGLSILIFGVLAVAVGFLANLVTPLVFGIGLVALLAIAGSMVGVSRILNEGIYDKYPPLEWALGVGLSILIFSVAAIAAAVGGIVGAVATLFTGGQDPLVKIASTMVSVSWLMQLGKWNGNYPKLDWAEGVGTALLLFASATVIAAGAGLATKIIGFFTGEQDPLMTLAQSMVNVSYKMQEGKWDGNYPKYDWALGVGTALAIFAAATVVAGGVGLATKIIGFFTGDKDPLMSLAKSMVSVSFVLQSGKWAGNYPKYDWALGVGTAMTLFAAITVASGGASLASAITGFFSGKKDPLVELARSMVQVSWILTTGKWNSFPPKDWITNVKDSVMQYIAISFTMAPFIDIFTRLEIDINMRRIVTSVVGIATILSSIDWNAVKYPTQDFINNYKYLMLEISYIISTINVGVYSLIPNFINFSTNSASALMMTSLIFDKGKYDIFPSKDYIDNFSYFIIVMSDTIRKADFNAEDSLTFLQSTLIVVPAIDFWIRMLSKSNYTNYPTFEYTNNFVYFVYMIGSVVNNWQLTVEDSVNFNSSIRFIVPAIEMFTKLPIVDMNFLSGMITMRLALSQIIASVNSFLYEDYEVSILFGALKVKGKRKKDLSDYVSFTNFIRTIAQGLKILGELKPIPDNAVNSFSKFLSYLDKMPKNVFNLNDKADGIKKLADSLMSLANSINTLNSSLTGFLDMSKGLFLISIIDDVKLDNVLKSIEKHQQALKIINKAPEEQASLLSTIKSLYDTIPKIDTAVNKEKIGLIDSKDTEKIKQEQFYSDISDIKNMMAQFMDYMDKPEQGASFHSK